MILTKSGRSKERLGALKWIDSPFDLLLYPIIRSFDYTVCLWPPVSQDKRGSTALLLIKYLLLTSFLLNSYLSRNYYYFFFYQRSGPTQGTYGTSWPLTLNASPTTFLLLAHIHFYPLIYLFYLLFLD